MEIKTSKQIELEVQDHQWDNKKADYSNESTDKRQEYEGKKWVAVDNHVKIIRDIGQLCVGKPSRYDSEQIEKIRKLCLKEIDTLSNENKKEEEK